MMENKLDESSKFDSDEEKYFSWYLDELVGLGYIDRYVLQPKTFELSEKVSMSWIKRMKTKNKLMISTILQPHEYTPDVGIEWGPKAENIFFNLAEGSYDNTAPFVAQRSSRDVYYSLIEIKPPFDQNNMTRLASINIKWVYQNYGVYIQKVVPIPISKTLLPKTALFPSSFTPKKYLFTDKSGQPRKIKFPVTTVEEFIEKRKSIFSL